MTTNRNGRAARAHEGRSAVPPRRTRGSESREKAPASRPAASRNHIPGCNPDATPC